MPWRRAEIPAAGGHGNARSVGAVQSVLACGGEVGGRRSCSEAGCRAVFEEQAAGTDLVLGVAGRFGIGYGLDSPGDADRPQRQQRASGVAGAARWSSTTSTPA